MIQNANHFGRFNGVAILECLVCMTLDEVLTDLSAVLAARNIMRDVFMILLGRCYDLIYCYWSPLCYCSYCADMR